MGFVPPNVNYTSIIRHEMT